MSYQIVTDLHGVKHPVAKQVVSLIEERVIARYISGILRKMRKISEYKERDHYNIIVPFLLQVLDETK